MKEKVTKAKKEKNYSEIREEKDRTFNGMSASEWALNSRSVWKDLPDISIDKNGYEIIPTELFDRLVNMYSKEGDVVLDPLVEDGRTVISTIRNNRFCYGIPTSEKSFSQARYNIENSINLLVNGEYKLLDNGLFDNLENIDDNSVQLIISSLRKPVLKRKRTASDIETGDPYENYLSKMDDLMIELYRVTKKGGYACFVASDFRDIKNKRPYVEFHSDIARCALKANFTYQDVIIYDHNDQRGLLLQGYPKVFYTNLNHTYIVILRKN